MTQPTPYSRGFSFTDYQASNPSDPIPAVNLDAELDHVQDTLEGVLGNLALIQRDDGKLADGCVTVDAVSAELLLAIAAAAPPGPQGDDGDPGPPGDPGDDAPPPNFTFETVTGAAGSSATLEATGVYPNLHLKFTVPRGNIGPGGGSATLPDGDYGDVASSGGGTVLTVQTVNGEDPYRPGNKPDIAAVNGLATALGNKQAADLGLTSLAGLAYGAATQLVALTGADTFGLFTIGQANGNILDKAAGDALYQAKAANLTALAALDWTAGTPFIAMTADGVFGLVDAMTQAAGDARYQPIGSYATTAQLGGKADALTTIKSFSTSQTVSDATHNGCYNKLTGAANRTITFNATPSDGHCSIWVNRGTTNMTIACAGGYYKDGAANTATANFSLAQGDKLTAFHEGGGVWTFEVV